MRSCSGGRTSWPKRANTCRTSSTTNDEQRALLIQAEAQLLREAKDYQESYELLNQALEKHPDNPDLLYDSAMAAEKLDRIDVVESNLRKLIALKPDHAQAYNALGYTLADRTDRFKEAKQYIEKALKLVARRSLHPRQHGLGAVSHGRRQGRRSNTCSAPTPAARSGDCRAYRRSAVGARAATGCRKGLARRLQGQPGQRAAAGDHEALHALKQVRFDRWAHRWW